MEICKTIPWIGDQTFFLLNRMSQKGPRNKVKVKKPGLAFWEWTTVV
jgi:hypothetical protein